MSKSAVASDQELLRLDQIATHLNVRARYPQSGFSDAVVAACVAKVDTIIRGAGPRSGEEIVAALAEFYGVTFEEVRTSTDVANLEQKYLVQRGELGFGQLRKELSDPGVDALLFHRTNARRGDSDEFVAVLNLQQTEAKSYWSKNHEMGHRIAEPRQKLLPFRRHRLERANPLESLIDQIAAELAYYPPVFGEVVEATAKNHRFLTFGAIRDARLRFAPSASLQATMNAMVKHWPRPAAALLGIVRGRKRDPNEDVWLRVDVQACNKAARKADWFFFPNMKVPQTSPMYAAHAAGGSFDGTDELGLWTTSTGGSLPTVTAYTSAKCVGRLTYAVLSLA
jgi:hypothetical protein